MKLLWLNTGLLLPLDKGGKLRTWHVMRHLAARHDITFLAFDGAADSEADRQGMRQVCTRLITVPRTERMRGSQLDGQDRGEKGTWRFYAQASRYVLDSLPYAVAKYRSAAYQQQIADLLARERFDAVVCDFLPPMMNLPDLPPRIPCPTILFTHNVEAEIWRRHAETASNIASKYLMTRQWRRMLRFEADALGRADLVLAVSTADARTFDRLYPLSLRASVHVIQTGVDTEYFVPAANEPSRTHMVFTGSMDWLPNEDGMTYFCREILPKIRQSEPDATLSIVGRAPTPAVRRIDESSEESP